MIANSKCVHRWAGWIRSVIWSVVLLLPCLPASGAPAGSPQNDALQLENEQVTGQQGNVDAIGPVHHDQHAGDPERARFSIPAESFTSRDNVSERAQWVRVASKTNRILEGAREGQRPETLPHEAQGDSYLLAIGKNVTGAPESDEHDGPSVTYRLNVTTPGTYRLYLRWAGRDNNTDSVYATITGPKGRSPAGPEYFLYHGRALKYYGGWVWDCVGVKDRTTCAFAGRPEAAEWEISEPGSYAIRLFCRESGTAVDTLVLQTVNLPSPAKREDAN